MLANHFTRCQKSQTNILTGDGSADGRTAIIRYVERQDSRGRDERFCHQNPRDSRLEDILNMKLDRKGIPLRVLNGKSRKYRSVHTIYRAVLMQELMTRVNKSFWARAKRGSDDLGNTWKPLSPKTHAYKPLSPMERKDYKLGNRLNRGLLTPSEDREWKRIFARTLARLEKQGVAKEVAKKKAAEKAWGIMKSRGAKTLIGLNRITDTNIRTGRLVAATKPGQIANNRYYPPKDQKVTITSRSINIKITVPYIKEVDAVRPVIPENIDKWMLEAHEIAINKAKQEYDRIKSATSSRKPRKRKSSKRNKR